MNKLLTSIFLIFSLIGALPLMAAESAVETSSIYYSIEEPFTINFLNQSQEKVRYLQIKVALMSHEPTVLDSAQHNLPMIQDALRTLFTEQGYDTVSTVAGREQLQQQALTKIRTLLQQETGSDGLEQIYFTSFILQ
ncbi:flagellar basal body-associated FliL family protein [Methylophaga thiooxydans]|uniref:flagellar basal body-associated FliL family protein n=1 Tax=Methylophaga thiooxydans TaxID=392484 RepID=UPI0023570EF9|nr:flagellar basal body-associated FliL family protein [Methylophaga thiooxydans]